MSAKKRQALFVFNEPGALRISPALAKEIGFSESIFFLQIEYLIGVSNTEEKDGKLWTFQSLQHLKDDYFPWWSTATLSRVAKRLEEKELIHIGNYNRIGYDRTQWYALNEDGIGKLKSIKLDVAILQNEKSNRAKRKMEVNKMKNGSQQNETPIPETPTETAHRESPNGETIGTCEVCGKENELLCRNSHKGEEYRACQECDLRGQLPARFERPETTYKKRVALALQNGQAQQASLEDQWFQLFKRRPNWKTNKSNAEAMAYFKARAKLGEDMGTVSEYWYKTDWRGKDGQVPTPAQMVEIWEGAFDEVSTPAIKKYDKYRDVY